MLSLVQSNKRSGNSQEKDSLGEEKQQNERRMAVPNGLLMTVGLYRVCKEVHKPVNGILTFCSCTAKKDGQSA